MKISGFVLDTRSGGVLDKCKEWNAAGLLSYVTLQVDSWPKAEQNIADFPQWKSALPGVKIYATVWGSGDRGVIIQRINDLRQKLHPDGWTLNFEKPFMEGVNVATIMQATKPEPVTVSYNGPAEQGAYDFRRYSYRGCQIDGQTYGQDADTVKEGPSPEVVVASAFKPRQCWTGPSTTSWWYRIYLQSSRKMKWVWVKEFDSKTQRLLLKTVYSESYWADGKWTGEALEFADSRAVRNASGIRIGQVMGFARYDHIGYTISVARPIDTDQIYELAIAARYPGMPLCTRGGFYPLEMASDDQFRCLASVA